MKAQGLAKDRQKSSQLIVGTYLKNSNLLRTKTNDTKRPFPQTFHLKSIRVDSEQNQPF